MTDGIMCRVDGGSWQLSASLAKLEMAWKHIVVHGSEALITSMNSKDRIWRADDVQGLAGISRVARLQDAKRLQAEVGIPEAGGLPL